MSAIDEAAELRRPTDQHTVEPFGRPLTPNDVDPVTALICEIAEWRRRLAGAQPHLVPIITRQIESLQAELEALLRPEHATVAPAAEERTGEKSAEIDLGKLPLWARDIVREHLDRKAAERGEAERQAAEAARIAHEEAVTAPLRAALRAPMTGHMGNRPGENFRLRPPQRVTRLVSTPEARHTVAMIANRLHEARIAAAANRLGGPVETAAPPIPIAGVGAPRPRAVISSLHMP